MKWEKSDFNEAVLKLILEDGSSFIACYNVARGQYFVNLFIGSDQHSGFYSNLDEAVLELTSIANYQKGLREAIKRYESQ